MIKINEMPYMKYIIDGIPPEIKKKAKDELGETEEIKAESLKEFKSLIKREPDLHACMEDVFLLRFLRTKKFRMDKAFKNLKNYYKFKATYSGIITDLRPTDVKHCLEMNFVSALEHRDSGYAGIGILRLANLDFRKITPDEMVASFFVLTEFGINMESLIIAGYCIILDFADISFYTLQKLASPSVLYKIISCIQDVIPCRIKGYHILNQPYFFNILFSVAKTLMSEKLASRLHLHGSNMKSLYKHIPQDILPEELGGKQGPMSQYLKEFTKIILDTEDHFIKMNKFGYQGKTQEELQKGNPHAIVT